MSEEKTYFTYREDLKTDQQREAWDRTVADAEAQMSARTGNVEQLRERIRELEEALQDIVDRIEMLDANPPPDGDLTCALSDISYRACGVLQGDGK